MAELHVSDISGEAVNGLKSLVENTRWRMMEVVTASWAKGMFVSIVVELKS